MSVSIKRMLFCHGLQNVGKSLRVFWNVGINQTTAIFSRSSKSQKCRHTSKESHFPRVINIIPWSSKFFHGLQNFPTAYNIFPGPTQFSADYKIFPTSTKFFHGLQNFSLQFFHGRVVIPSYKKLDSIRSVFRKQLLLRLYCQRYQYQIYLMISITKIVNL